MYIHQAHLSYTPASCMLLPAPLVLKLLASTCPSSIHTDDGTKLFPFRECKMSFFPVYHRALYSSSNFLLPLVCIVRLHGRDAEAHGAVCLLHNGANRPQTAGWYDSTRHQPVLLSLLHVQSRPGALYQREYRCHDGSLDYMTLFFLLLMFLMAVVKEQAVFCGWS